MTPDLIAGDPVWQKIAGLAALIFLLWNMRDGYRKGFWRKLTGLIALGAAWAAAWFFNAALAKELSNWLPYPQILLRALAGTLIALAVYALVKGIAGRRGGTENQDKAHGAFFGLLAGFFVGSVWIAVIWTAVRFIGTVSLIALQTTGQPLAQSCAEHPNITALIKLKTSLDMGEAGRITQKLDPVPETFYRLCEKTIRLLSSPEACEALSKNPRLKPLLEDPEIVALSNDEEVQRLVRERNFHTLLRNKKVRTAADSLQVQEKLKAIDVEAAIDAALTKACPPAPIATPKKEKILPESPPASEPPLSRN